MAHSGRIDDHSEINHSGGTEKSKTEVDDGSITSWDAWMESTLPERFIELTHFCITIIHPDGTVTKGDFHKVPSFSDFVYLRDTNSFAEFEKKVDSMMILREPYFQVSSTRLDPAAYVRRSIPVLGSGGTPSQMSDSGTRIRRRHSRLRGLIASIIRGKVAIIGSRLHWLSWSREEGSIISYAIERWSCKKMGILLLLRARTVLQYRLRAIPVENLTKTS
jgi:hypothetical protein